jgi:hypothetical protein
MSSQSLPRPLGADSGKSPLSASSDAFQCVSMPAEPVAVPITAMNDECKAELQRKLKSILKELIELKDFQVIKILAFFQIV